MAKWIQKITIIAVIFSIGSTNATETCHSHLSILKGQQISCVNTTASFFENFERPLNRTHWLTCANCTLPVLEEATFNFPKNNISYLYLLTSHVRVLRKFAFYKFPLLRFLILRDNDIETVDRKAFCKIKKLLQLDLSKNHIKILTNSLFSELENLDILSVNNNGIFYIQPDAFVGLINLKYLYMNNNQLNKLVNGTFKYLTNLKILYLENNKIFEIATLAFANLKNLNYLYLSNNSITYLVQYNFKPLTSLVDLQLRKNNLSVIETSSFNGLNNLRYLYLGANHISRIKPYGFVGLNMLETLDLTENEFSFINFQYFTSLDNLSVLWLGKNMINNFTIEYKTKIQNSLTILDLNQNNLSTINYKILHNTLPNIRDIFITNNTWKCEFLVNMYNFFENTSVSLCTRQNCNVNATKLYIEDVCASEITESTSEDFPEDFSTSKKDTLVCLKFLTVSAVIFVVII